MENILTGLFGQGSNLDATQMMSRGLVVFALTLVMIRLSGRRSFGQHTPFDACLTVLLGSILARSIVGVSPFFPTIATGIALALLHRGIAMLSVRSPHLDRLINGDPRTLVLDGYAIRPAMRKSLVSEADVLQAVRENAHLDDLTQVHKIMLERNGVISVVK